MMCCYYYWMFLCIQAQDALNLFRPKYVCSRQNGPITIKRSIKLGKWITIDDTWQQCCGSKQSTLKKIKDGETSHIVPLEIQVKNNHKRQRRRCRGFRRPSVRYCTASIVSSSLALASYECVFKDSNPASISIFKKQAVTFEHALENRDMALLRFFQPIEFHPKSLPLCVAEIHVEIDQQQPAGIRCSVVQATPRKKISFVTDVQSTVVWQLLCSSR
ncbi:unnamed protein product [Didymodactylos carnosus]|uniref:Uncharacterized protein n=1 Tax=Didymodactylos carnosus TaxID=1234261 RepID=A0A814W974_9BILA|nr:unnamed protein product [Didymodactylos carnosus]CAF1199116.1 unnamed protein product [Didymodactylos carnosus]CAF3775225.1 unnamed protein product [Didymodactylos carnosus]CAF3963736.1 unnamed protein product [Didymodactylos carnosus]